VLEASSVLVASFTLKPTMKMDSVRRIESGL